MTGPRSSKYGAPLTGSDWVGLPLRVGHIPESGHLEELSTDSDAVLVWTGGPSEVTINYRDPVTEETRQHQFERYSGMMDLLPRGTVLHRVEWKGRASVCVSVNLPQDAMRALSESPKIGLIPERGPQFGLIDAHVVDLVRRLQEQAEGREFFGALYVQSLSLALASYLAARYGAEAKSEPIPRAAALSGAQRNHIESFVQAELSSNFGLVDLAALVGYCPDHFSRLFKSAFQQSPYQYVLSCRIEKAMAMLRDETISIAAIASACGFSNQGHLTTAFKRRTGMTPGAYRRA